MVARCRSRKREKGACDCGTRLGLTKAGAKGEEEVEGGRVGEGHRRVASVVSFVSFFFSLSRLQHEKKQKKTNKHTNKQNGIVFGKSDLNLPFL